MSSARRQADILEVILEDYLSRRDRGESPIEQEYLDRHPELNQPLREFFTNLRILGATSASPPFQSPIDVAATQKPDDEMESSASTILGNYRLIEPIGQGSQGVVYRAEQMSTRRIVALKVLRDGALASSLDRAQLDAEGVLASRLKHPHIVTVYERGSHAQCEYLAMEFVPGKPLDRFVRERELDIRATIRLFLQVCDAVGFAHQHGVLHRDLKPTNILVNDSGHALVLDFGLAKVLEDLTADAAHASRIGEFNGSWHYASPEQALRDPSRVGFLSDVYALGVILFELLTGELPYPILGQDRETMARHILQTPPAKPSSIRRSLDRDLDAVLLKCLEKTPAERYQSAAELARELHRFLDGEPIEARRASVSYLIFKTMKRHRWRLAATMAALLVVFVMTGAIVVSRVMRATARLRETMMREVQGAHMQELDLVPRMTNTLQHIAYFHPELREIKRFARLPMQDTQWELSAALEGIPVEIENAATVEDLRNHRPILEWIVDHDERLDAFQRHLRERRLVFAWFHAPVDTLLVSEIPGEDTRLATRLGMVFVARALWSHEYGDDEACASSFGAAQSIALDMVDARWIQQKDPAFYLMDQVFDAALRVISGNMSTSRQATPVIEWALSVPPILELGHALIAEKQAVLQLLNEGVVARTDGGPGGLDADKLDRAAGGVLKDNKLLTDELREIARGTSHKDAEEAAHDYFHALDGLCSVRGSNLRSEFETLETKLRARPAWRIVRNFVPRCYHLFEYRARLCSRRNALVLAAHCCRMRAVAGHWPTTLEQAVQGDSVDLLRDPYSGLNFGYLIRDDMPLLFSAKSVSAGDTSTPALKATENDVVFIPWTARKRDPAQ